MFIVLNQLVSVGALASEQSIFDEESPETVFKELYINEIAPINNDSEDECGETDDWL